MVKAVEDGARQDATGELWRARNELLLADALVRPCLIVEDDERSEQAPEVLVPKHEDVVEQLPPERAHEALSEGVHVRRAYGRAGYFLDPYNPMCVTPPSGSRDASHR